jgi:translation initiation factor 4A|tara:strand:+ start:1136 stop:2347 length:1212 start_codon:yes stop_codon:yes gene_type:complete
MSEKTETTNNKDFRKEISEWDDPDLNLRPNILRGIFAYGFEKPSPIQKKGLIPLIQPGCKGKRRDILAQAQSGTGKTACFGVGALQIIDSTKDETQVLILAPTHELASQIKNVIADIGRFEKVKVQLLVGGTSVDSDRSKLDNETPQIVVGTPGRVHDMIRRKYLKTDKMELIVIDEADEMLSQGFKEQIYKIFQYMNNNIQIGLFSATVPEVLQELSGKFMRNPIKILVKAEQLTLQGIAQYYIRLDNDEQKYSCIKDLFEGLTISQAIIYCNSTRRVDDLEEAMVQDEFPVKKIHGKMEESERKDVHNDFKAGGCRVLVTSDLFARGIDIQQVSVVINFDVPKSEHTYLHRIGRSGRWGRKGIAINFVTRHDGGRLKEFEEYYSTEIKEMPADWGAHLKDV